MPAATITFPAKVTGDQLQATEVNSLKDAINDHAQRLDMTGVKLDAGTVLHFTHHETLHPVLYTGTFTTNTSALLPGASEVIVLGPGASLPTTTPVTGPGGVVTPAMLDPTIFRTNSPPPGGPAASGRGWQYAFKVRYDGQHIDYVVRNIEL